jgi:hypothetical protein
MISKRVGIAPKNDNYARLAAYIADAVYDGEKSLLSWCAGCLGDDDYAAGMEEAVKTQERNPRGGAKTYHMVVSFRPEDEARLTPEVCKDIETRFAAALGYSEHQRHCGVHRNTANLHMHVAYNMIHPEKYTKHKEFRDYWIRDRVCRELEREYGLAVDNGRGQAMPERQPLGEKAALIEAHTGQQSFEGYVKDQRAVILQALEVATSWRETHDALARHGLEIKPHGNGLVIKDRHGKQAMKASDLDRSLALKKLESRFGVFIPTHERGQIQEQSRYQAEPLQRSPERGKLFAEYRQGIEERKTRLERIKQQEDAALAATRAEWATKRREIERMSMDKRNRRRLIQVARKHEAEALAKARHLLQEPREEVRRDIPFTSWNGFLRHKAEQGNEVALAVLRSNKEAAEVENVAPITQGKDWSQHGRDQFSDRDALKAVQAAQERGVLESEALSSKGKTRLLAVLRMEQLAEEERRSGKTTELGTLAISGFQHTVDRKGTVIFTLPGGGRIMDTGRELFFSSQDPAAQNAALAYARKKWGKAVCLEGNKICREQSRDIELERMREQNRGIGR